MAVDIRKRIRDLRKSKGMSAKEVSEKMGISRPFYTQLEGGTRRLSVQYLEGIASALSTTVSDLYSEDGRPLTAAAIAQVARDESPELAKKLRPYLGKNSDEAAETVKSLDKATKSLRKLKSDKQ
jgi:transcriptional regulator with XRE-family HTH domain